MSTIELINAISCVILTPGLTFLGVAVWNAVVMPGQLRRPIALLLWMQAATCSTFLVGMTLQMMQIGKFSDWVSALLLGAQALTVVVVLVRMFQLHRHLIAVSLIVLLVLLLSGAQ